MKKGFTLVELLAVIIILAIIAVIATPIVIDIIDDAKIESVKNSTRLYLKAVKIYISNEDLNKMKFEPGIYEIMEDGNICIGIMESNKCSGEIIEIELKGNKPTGGKITLEEENIKIDYLEIGEYIYYNDNKVYKKTQNETVESINGVITLSDSKVSYLTNYKIYGNSYQETRSGKNLFDVNSYSYDYQNYLGISAKNLIVGRQYTISSDVPIKWLKISTQSTGYNSVQKKSQEGITSYTFTMARNENIPSTSNQYIFISFDNSGTFCSDLNEMKSANIQIEEGTIATEYEEYGKTPSQEFPSEIQSVGNLVTDEKHECYGKYEIPIRVTGKNLWNKEYASNYENWQDIGYGYASITVPVAKGNNISISKSKLSLNDFSYFKIRSNNKDYWMHHNTLEVYLKTNLSFVALDNEIFVHANIYNATSHENFLNMINENLQIEINESSTPYEPYKENNYYIYIDEPLRCVGDVCDYIDYKKGKVVRYIEELNIDSTKSIEENLVAITNPKMENIELPNININEGVTNIFIETTVKPSKFIVDYNK